MDHCLPQVYAERLRVALLDPITGATDPGAGNMYVSGSLVRLGIEYVYQDGEEITDRTGNGSVCLDIRGRDTFRRVNVTIELCSHDPVLQALFAGDLLEEGDRLGWAAPPIGTVEDRVLSVEGWASRIVGGVNDPDFPYAWHVLPFVKNVRPGTRELANARQANIFTGQGYENGNWFDGPMNDFPGVETDRAHFWVESTADELPEATCGALELVAS